MKRPDPAAPWTRLYHSDRIASVRFVQLVCLALGVVCVGLLWQTRDLPANPDQPYDWAIAAVVAALAAVLPNAGMVWYLRRYVLAVEVQDDRMRLTLPRLLVGRWTRTLHRADVLRTSWNEGRADYRLAVSVNAPWTWVVTRDARYILDGQGDGTSEVEDWLGKGSPRPATSPKVRNGNT